ncbi:MAG: RDD family protein [Bacillota bacterium]
MDEQVSVITPESVGFSLEVAGLGSRFLALLLDSLFKGVVVAIIVALTVLSAPGMGGGVLTGVFMAVGLVLAGLVAALYHAVLEAAWSGRTPGKRIMGLRVVKDSGVPIGFLDALIRNLLRIVDYLPSFYLVGVITIFATPRHKRIGDLAAGTVVIKERSLKDVAAPAAPTRADLGLAPVVPAPGPIGTEAAVPELGAPVTAAPVAALLPPLTYDEEELLRDFLRRRGGLAPEPRAQLAARLAALLRGKGAGPADLGLAPDAPDEAFLEAWSTATGV